MARRRYELTDREWAIIEPLLPNKPRGMPRVDDRRVLNGIMWRFRSGATWAEVPERYGPPKMPPANAPLVGALIQSCFQIGAELFDLAADHSLRGGIAVKALVEGGKDCAHHAFQILFNVLYACGDLQLNAV